MKVICDKYDICKIDCAYKKFYDWDGKILSLNNYCALIRQEIIFVKISDIRKKKLIKINESNL